ncbi:paired amphipathic helix protein Sin3-like 5 [Triticum dicoccoides]|uniref:paired amphipathic helix protein Sin3-like 5 n=1 Tax=Triticum dicoccoides TaxID=85692 RepID=UPI000E7BB554|nr:paired amphipathic helix protein Sin3-like 5 [Triticum dicoccoides]
MASSDEADDDNYGYKTGKKGYTVETVQCLLFARDNLPSHVYRKFVKAMTEVWKNRADPDGEIRNICPENCIETALKLFQGWATVKQSFLNFIEGRSPVEGNGNADADAEAVVVNPLIQKPMDFLSRLKACPNMSDDHYAAFLKIMQDYFRDRTMTPRKVYKKVRRCMRDCPELLEEFVDNFLPADLKAFVKVKANDNHRSDGIHMKEGYGELHHAEEDEEDKVKPLPDWNSSKAQELPPEVDPKKLERASTPSYYLLPDNLTLHSSYWTNLGRSILNDTLVCSVSGMESSKHKTINGYETNILYCEEDMFESDMLLHRFRATADLIANLQTRAGIHLKISEHLTPLHRRCIEKLYDDDPELDDLLESPNTSSVLAVLLSRLKQKVEDLSEARSYLHKAHSQVIAKNYYRSLDHRGLSFKQLDAKRMSQKALLAEANEINKKNSNAGDKNADTDMSNAGDKHADTDMHKDISSIISSACASEEKQVMNWAKIVHPFLSAHCLWPSSKETVAPAKACEHCRTSKDFLSSIPDALPATKLPSPSKRGEFIKKNSNDLSSSHDGFGQDIEEGDFMPEPEIIESDVMLGAGKEPVSCDVATSGIDGLSSHCRMIGTSEPSTRDHGYKHEKQHESRQHSKTSAKLRGVKGGTCCFLIVLRRLYQILYDRLQTARSLCADDLLYAEFKEKIIKLHAHCIDNSSFEDFCLQFLGPKSVELFTLDIVINRVIKQLCIIYSRDQDNSLFQFLENFGRPVLPKPVFSHQNFPNNPSNGLPKYDQEEQEKALADTEKLPRHFERRKKRKLENGATSSSAWSSSQLGAVTKTHG